MKKMLNVICHRGNEIKTTMRSPHTHQDALIKKTDDDRQQVCGESRTLTHC